MKLLIILIQLFSTKMFFVSVSTTETFNKNKKNYIRVVLRRICAVNILLQKNIQIVNFIISHLFTETKFKIYTNLCLNT